MQKYLLLVAADWENSLTNTQENAQKAEKVKPSVTDLESSQIWAKITPVKSDTQEIYFPVMSEYLYPAAMRILTVLSSHSLITAWILFSSTAVCISLMCLSPVDADTN